MVGRYGGPLWRAAMAGRYGRPAVFGETALSKFKVAFNEFIYNVGSMSFTS